MPNQTPELGIPYPTQGDQIDVAADIQALAEALEDGTIADTMIPFRIFASQAARDLWLTPPYGALAYTPDMPRPFVGADAPGIWLWDSEGDLWAPLIAVTGGDLNISPGEGNGLFSMVASNVQIAEDGVMGLIGELTVGSVNTGSVKLPNWSAAGGQRVNVVAAGDDDNRLMEDPGSSGRLKTDIRPLTVAEARTILGVEPVVFRYRFPAWREAAGDGFEVGMIAEQVATCDERLVSVGPPLIYNDDGEPMTEVVPDAFDAATGKTTTRRRRMRGPTPQPNNVNYQRFVAPLLVLMQEKDDQINDLTARLEALEAASA